MEKKMTGFTDALAGMTFAIPLWEVVLLLVIFSVFLLSGKHKMGLIVSYVFALYWIFISQRAAFMDIIGNSPGFIFLYVIAGLVMAMIIVISIFVESR